MNMDSIPGELDAIKLRVGRLEDSLDENTRITRENADVLKEVRDTMVAAKWLHRFVLWIAPLVAATVAGWAWIKDHFKA
jgi:hypothetical protein